MYGVTHYNLSWLSLDELQELYRWFSGSLQAVQPNHAKALQRTRMERGSLRLWRTDEQEAHRLRRLVTWIAAKPPADLR